MTLEIAFRLFDGVYVEDMSYVPEISTYNHNYFMFDGKLLFGKSDDDNFTAWFWIRGDKVLPIGGSYCSDGDKIQVGEQYC